MQLSIYFNEDDRTLYGEVAPDDSVSEPVTPALIRQRLEQQGYPDLKINPQSVNQLCAAANNKQALTLPLKTLVDATVNITVSSDSKRALLTLTPADGGLSLTMDDIKQQVQQVELLEELVNWQTVQAALERGQVKEVCIANAKPAVNGSDAVYMPLVTSEVDQVPVVDENGVADMLSAHSFTLVDQGEALMRRQPATSGEPGMDVTGKEIPPVPGKDPGFAKGIEGAEIAQNDENLLIATIKGHPVLLANGVSVDPVLHVDNVDLSTGNIEFDGSLEVRGDVAPGMKINVTGDVVVKGTVERAEIIAGHHVLVQGGIFGDEKVGREPEHGSENQSGQESQPESESEAEPGIHFAVQAKGNIEAGFLNLVAVKAEQDVVVKQYIGNSYVEAGRQILLGQNGGKGVCFGGSLQANQFAHIAQLGNDTYVETQVRVGRLDQLQAQHQQIEDELEARRQEANQLQAIYDKISQKDPGMLGKVSVDKTKRIANTIAAIRETIQSKQQALQALVEAMDKHRNAMLIIGKRIYPNTLIIINGARKRFHDEYRGDSWINHNGQIIPQSEKED